MDFGSPTRLYAKNELEQYFELDIQEVAITNELPISDCYDRIKECYNGYKFSKNAELVYNPFSTLKLLNSKDFSSYWFETAHQLLLLRKHNAASYWLKSRQICIRAYGIMLNFFSDRQKKSINYNIPLSSYFLPISKSFINQENSNMISKFQIYFTVFKYALFLTLSVLFFNPLEANDLSSEKASHMLDVDEMVTELYRAAHFENEIILDLYEPLMIV